MRMVSYPMPKTRACHAKTKGPARYRTAYRDACALARADQLPGHGSAISASDFHVVTVEHHHLVPHLHKGFHEALVAIAAGVHFRHRA